MAEIVLVAFYFVILMYSIIIHEVSHGIAAFLQGDPTAKYAGRLTLDPRKHIDPMGSILVPFIMLVATDFKYAFGWAKPVPYNPYNLRNQKWGDSIVALSGPLSNILIALIFAIAAKFIHVSNKIEFIQLTLGRDWEGIASRLGESFSAIFYELIIMIIFWNILLAFFNLIPIPPLDGSKLLYNIFSISNEKKLFLEQFGFFILIGVLILDAMTFNIFGNLLYLFWSFFFSITI